MEDVYDQGDEAAEFLTNYLGSKTHSFRLVYMDQDVKIPVDPKYALTKDDMTSFSDGYAFLVINENSLIDLNNRLIRKYERNDAEVLLKMNRFRPNIVVSGLKAFEEDNLFRYFFCLDSTFKFMSSFDLFQVTICHSKWRTEFSCRQALWKMQDNDS